jgi:beta-lactamase class C
MLRRLQRISLHLLILTVPVSSLTPALKTRDEARLNAVLHDFDAFVEIALDAWNLPGMAIAVVENDSIVFLKGYGVRRIDRPDPIDTHTVFRIASVSKTFASTLTGILVEEGVLNWNDRVYEYLPNFSLKDSVNTYRLTIRHILSHTSGLIPHTYDNLIEANRPYRKMVSALKDVPLMGQPGKRYGYQNVVFSLIGDIVESATGKSYETLVYNKLFKPLEMTDASLGWNAYLAKTNRASPHIVQHYTWKAMDDKKAYYSVLPSAGVNASISDMAQWLRAQMGATPDIVSPAILQSIHTPRVRTPGELPRYHWNGHVRNAYYGMGWRIFDYAGHTMITHSGGIEGYLAQLAFIPDLKIGMVVLMNSRKIDFLLPTFFDMYLGIDETSDDGQ